MANARRQKVIIEYHDNHGPEWWLMQASGDVDVFDTASAALNFVKAKARKGNKGVTLTHIEWRNVPEGFVNPQ